jgi:hypothetical protein
MKVWQAAAVRFSLASLRSSLASVTWLPFLAKDAYPMLPSGGSAAAHKGQNLEETEASKVRMVLMSMPTEKEQFKASTQTAYADGMVDPKPCGLPVLRVSERCVPREQGVARHSAWMLAGKPSGGAVASPPGRFPRTWP